HDALALDQVGDLEGIRPDRAAIALDFDEFADRRVRERVANLDRHLSVSPWSIAAGAGNAVAPRPIDHSSARARSVPVPRRQPPGQAGAGGAAEAFGPRTGPCLSVRLLAQERRDVEPLDAAVL